MTNSVPLFSIWWLALPVAFAVILTVLFIVVHNKVGGLYSIIFKTIASIGFVSIGVTAMYLNQLSDSYVLLFILGAVLGLGGDVVLGLLEIDEGRNNKDFVITIGSLLFFIGHALYYCVMLFMFGFSFYPLIFGVVATVGIMLNTKLMKLKMGSLIYILSIYTFALTTVVAQAFYMMIVSSWSLVSIAMFVGFVLFLISDMILSFQYFKEGSSPRLNIPNYITYYCAQIILMISLALI